MSFEPGTTISHYKILSVIGKGGMGEVYLAEDTRLGRSVALKMLTDECCEDSEKLQRFEQEAKTSSALNHPNIITVYEFGEFEDLHFMASEYIDGTELNNVLAKENLGLESVLEISIQIISALKTAHEAGIIHRDIKPQNIMLRKDGIAKVLDFGLAKLTNRPHREKVDDTAATIARMNTIPGLVMGTPNYMSPEQARGREIDHQTDIFSFGVVLYEMLTQIRPFDGETTSDVIAAVLTKKPRPIREVDPNLPPELEAIADRSLRKDKRERYQNADDLLNDLNELKNALNIRQVLKTGGETNPGVGSSGISSQMAVQREPRESIAILPFVNLSIDKGHDYFCEGLTEEVIMSLSKLQTLKVVARGLIMQYVNEGKTHKQMADDLGVQYLLEGSVRRQGGDLRITAQLVDTAYQAYLWSETYRGTIKDIFEIQEKVATEIVHALRIRLSPVEEQNLKKRFTENTEAYQLYLQGRFFWNKRSENALKTAIKYFEQAIELDQNYAIAWAGIADSYSLLGEFGTLPRKVLLPKAQAAANRALEIDDGLAEVHTSHAMLLLMNEWDWVGAKRAFDRALQLDPDYATAYHWYSHWFLGMGDLEESKRLIFRAAELDPVSQAIIKDKGNVLYHSEQYDAAIEWAFKTLELDPEYPAAHRLLSLAYQGKEMFDEAIEANDHWGRLTGNDAEANFGLAQILAVAGRHDEARKIAQKLEKEASTVANVFRGLALVYAGLREDEKAFGLLEKSLAAKEESLLNVKVDPKMKRLHTDSRFTELLKKIGVENGAS